ncbi:MAG TPA: glycosyltransferase family 1 protein [Candidatus Saccharimonadales bacterium]|nr:glycosyltransferase family 1 protein [Candidatus Saccharimonadales bacterium]
MSRLVIDARESGTSTGRYVDKLVEYLARSKPSFEIVVLTKPHRVDYLRSAAPAFDVQPADYKEFSFAEQFGLKRRIKHLRPDLVHFAKDHQPVLYRGPAITTMHDLTTLRFRNPAKHWLVFGLKQFVYKRVVKLVARKSVTILTPSKFVKDDIVRYTGANPTKITVTYEAADIITDAPEPIVGLDGKQFLVYLGRPTPHKNLERLIDAFVKIRASHPQLMLVLAGKKDANYERIESDVRSRGIRGVYFAGFANEGRLRWLYENCAAYVFPSLSEGFGLPGLEAMTHGAPVVSSNATCLPEIYGDAAHYFDPLDTQAMADAINEVLTDKDLRAGLIRRGREQAKKYSWQRMAEQTLSVYEQILK